MIDLVTIADIDALIAGLRDVAANDLILPQDHNDVKSIVSKIRDLLGGGSSALIKTWTTEIVNQVGVAIPDDYSYRSRVLDSYNLGLTRMQQFFLIALGQAETMSTEGAFETRISIATHLAPHPKDETVTGRPVELFDYVDAGEFGNPSATWNFSYGYNWTIESEASHSLQEWSPSFVVWLFGGNSDTAYSAFMKNLRVIYFAIGLW